MTKFTSIYIFLLLSEGISNSGQTVWYAFELVHSVALSAFLPGPTGSANRVYKKKYFFYYRVENFKIRTY